MERFLNMALGTFNGGEVQTWSASGAQASTDWLGTLGAIGAGLLGAAFLFAIVRAAKRNQRYRAVDRFSDGDLERVHEAIRVAERKTVGEILPVVVERSDPHPGAIWIAALVSLIVGTLLLGNYMPWGRPSLLMACQLGLGATGFLAARYLPDFKRLFISNQRAASVAAEQAFQEFYGNGLHETEAATGVLLFVSLLEHRVIVMGDTGINARVSSEDWQHTDNAILEGIRAGSLIDGLIGGIESAAELLEEHFPWTEGDRNEIPDRVIIRHE